MSDEGDACFYNAKAPVVNIKSSSLLWGRILFASGSPENLAANQFSEKICVLNLGFFLEVKSPESNSDRETHSLLNLQNRIELITHSILGLVIKIRKNANMFLYLAQKDKLTSCNNNWNETIYLHSHWCENSIVMWYIVLKIGHDTTSFVHERCVAVLPRSEKTGNKALVARCSLLTSPDNAALTSVLPTFSLPSVTQLTKFILDLDSQLESKKLSLNRCYPLTNPNLPLYSIDGKPLWFNLRFTGDLDVSDTAIQKMNPLTDVHYFTVGPRGKYLVEEQMSGSTLLFYIPSKLCSAYIRHFDFANKLMSSLPKSDQTNQMEVLRRALVHVAEYLREVCGQLSAGIDKSTCSKKSDWKNDKWSSFLSLNMQIYSVKLFQVEMPDLETLDSIAEQNQCIDYFVTSQEITNDNRKLDQPTDLKASEVRHWDVLTVGGPTPHALDSSGTGRSLIRFEELAKLHLEVTKYLLKQDAEHGNVRDMYAGFGLSFTDVFIRRDLAVLSLIVTPLCTSLMRALETHKSDELFWKILVNTRKVHFSWLSLINDSGDEREMMRDFIAAVNYVNRYVKFIFVEGDNGFFPLIDIDLLGDILVTIYLPNNEGLPDKRSVFVSKYLKHGKHLQFDCCVHFLNQRLIPAPSGTDTTGATNALGAVGKLSSLQVEIFRDLHDSFITGHLTETIEKLAHTFGQNNEVERLKSSKEKLSQCILSSEYLDRSAKFPPAIDHINEFIVASRLSRCIRLCSCKSAKDRTAMGATYEMAELICEYIDSVQKSSRFQPGDQIRGALLDSLRRGVRLRNCKMNAGLPKYKFTSLNQRLMPQVFKPPEGTYTGSNSVST